jgi:hypothetical protein
MYMQRAEWREKSAVWGAREWEGRKEGRKEGRDGILVSGPHLHLVFYLVVCLSLHSSTTRYITAAAEFDRPAIRKKGKGTHRHTPSPTRDTCLAPTASSGQTTL